MRFLGLCSLYFSTLLAIRLTTLVLNRMFFASDELAADPFGFRREPLIRSDGGAGVFDSDFFFATRQDKKKGESEDSPKRYSNQLLPSLCTLLHRRYQR